MHRFRATLLMFLALGLLLADICPGRPGDNPNELPDELIQEP